MWDLAALLNWCTFDFISVCNCLEVRLHLTICFVAKAGNSKNDNFYFLVSSYLGWRASDHQNSCVCPPQYTPLLGMERGIVKIRCPQGQIRGNHNSKIYTFTLPHVMYNGFSKFIQKCFWCVCLNGWPILLSLVNTNWWQKYIRSKNI
jgi:hypothetical protein